jgi:hypothetical protein
VCDLVVDVEVELGSFTGDPNGSTPVTCASGRVILAASAFTGSLGSAATTVPVRLASGALSDTCTVATTAAVTVNYCLTTGRAATL